MEFLAKTMDSWQRRPDVLFCDVVKEGEPIVPQIEKWAASQNLELPTFWKVELAKRVKQRALDAGQDNFDEKTISKWQCLFNALEQ